MSTTAKPPFPVHHEAPYFFPQVEFSIARVRGVVSRCLRSIVSGPASILAHCFADIACTEAEALLFLAQAF